MSLQDKIFDIEAALKGTPEAAAFDSVCETFYMWERERHVLLGALRRIKQAQETLREFCALELPENLD